MSKFKNLSIVLILVTILGIGGLVSWAGQEQPRYGGTLIVG